GLLAALRGRGQALARVGNRQLERGPPARRALALGGLAVGGARTGTERVRAAARLLEAEPRSFDRRPGREHPPGEQLMALPAARQVGLGALTAGGDPGQGVLDGPAPLARRRRGGLPLGGRRAPSTRVVARELQAGLQRLALEALVELGGVGLALERPEPGARLALDVQRAVQVVLGADQLELGTPAALAVLAQSGGLLD